MKNKKGLRTPDLISIGIYSALYILMVGIAAMLCVFLLPGYSYIFIPIIAALLTGTIFMLAATKVPKFGTITIISTMMGVFYLVGGRWPFAIIPAFIFGLIADVVATYLPKRRSNLLASYIIFSYGCIGPIVPLLFFRNYYVQDLINHGRDQAYINSVFENITSYTGIFVMVAIFIAAIIGGLFGQRMLKKHFKKAGII